MIVMKWCISEQGYKNLARFSRFVLFNLQLVLCKRLTRCQSLSLTVCLYTFISCYLEKIIKIGFPELEKNFSNDFALSSQNDCLSIKA